MAEPSDAIQYQPRLAWYSQAWRLLVCALYSGTALALVAQQSRPVWWVLGEVVVGIAALVWVLLRRRWPLAVALSLVVVSAVFGAAAGPAALALVSLATRRQWLPTLSVAAAFLVLPGAGGLWFDQVFGRSEPTDWTIILSGFGISGALVGAGVGWGAYIGSRRALVWTLRERAERAEAERGLRVERAREQERARIAREMHDVLAHRITHVSMQAGAMAYRDGLTNERLRAGYEVIQSSANAALRDLRQILGVLRESTDPADTSPQPGQHGLAELVERALTVQPVQLNDTLQAPETLGETTGRTVYRIVQEGLTNATKHAPGSTVEVSVSGAAEVGVSLTVRNRVGFEPPADVPSSGLGLIGLKERAELAGGRLTTTRTADSFMLQAWLPWIQTTGS